MSNESKYYPAERIVCEKGQLLGGFFKTIVLDYTILYLYNYSPLNEYFCSVSNNIFVNNSGR